MSAVIRVTGRTIVPSLTIASCGNSRNKFASVTVCLYVIDFLHIMSRVYAHFSSFMAIFD